MGLAVVGLLFEYLAMLRDRGPQAWVYQELRDIGVMKSRYVEEEDAMEYVTNVSSNMLLVQPPHILLSEYLHEDWDPSLVSADDRPASTRLACCRCQTSYLAQPADAWASQYTANVNASSMHLPHSVGFE